VIWQDSAEKTEKKKEKEGDKKGKTKGLICREKKKTTESQRKT